MLTKVLQRSHPLIINFTKQQRNLSSNLRYMSTTSVPAIASGVAVGAVAAASAIRLASAKPIAKPTKLKLYIYDHCPFCARARLILGLKKIPHDLVFMASADEETPTNLVGKKVAPILQPIEGKAFSESMDIVRYIDENCGGSSILKESANREDLKKWLEDSGKVFPALYFPRDHLAPFAEFAKLEDREYFRHKKEKTVGSFEEALARTPELVKEANVLMAQLEPMFHSNRTFNAELSYDDIDLFGRLRIMTHVKDLIWPKKIREYVDHMSKEGDVLLFDAYKTC